MSDTESVQKTSSEYGCKQCGAVIKYKPGSTHLVCEFCGATQEIKIADVEIVENSFEEILNAGMGHQTTLAVKLIKCGACAAEVSVKSNITSDSCPFCGSNLVVQNAHEGQIIKPSYVLPFQIEIKQAREAFKKWLSKLWFAPGDLKKYAESDDRFQGIYLPYWTYDSATTTKYTGERGEHYYETQTVRVTENGQSVTREQQVQKTRWSPASGIVQHSFDDVLVLASCSLKDHYTRPLEPWDLKKLVGYDENFLSGYRSESYQVDVKEGFMTAKEVMKFVITDLVESDIGGDEQRITTLNTQYDKITFKHILLPVWISAYRYSAKIYRFIVNAQTGEVHGERPWSVIKIILFVLMILGVMGILAYFNN